MFPWQGTRISLLPQASNLCLGCPGVAPLFLAHSQEVKPASCFASVKFRLESVSSLLASDRYGLSSTLPPPLQPLYKSQAWRGLTNSPVPILQILTLTPPNRKCQLPASSAQSQAHKTARLWVLPACACWEDAIAEANRKCSWIQIGCSC